jgi:hypothetical protein
MNSNFKMIEKQKNEKMGNLKLGNRKDWITKVDINRQKNRQRDKETNGQTDKHTDSNSRAFIQNSS